MKKKIFDILQIGDKSNIWSRGFDFFLVIIIFMNIGSMFMQTFETFADYMEQLKLVEYVTTVLFCVEYILRIWTADYLYPSLGKIKSKAKFLVSFDGVVDLLTIIPVFFLTGFVAFRMLRVVRIFHLFRLNAKYDSFNVITTVLLEKKNQILSSVFIIIILMLAGSLGMYSAEHEAQPEVFDNAFSGIWWSVSTILTVGYGDIYPVTILGKCMAIMIAFLGVGAVAIPTGIISAGFVQQYSENQRITNYKRLDMSEIVEIEIDAKLSGKSMQEIGETEGLYPYLVLRSGMSILPSDDLIVKKKDVIIARIMKDEI